MFICYIDAIVVGVDCDG